MADRNRSLSIVLVLLVVAVLAGLGWFVWQFDLLGDGGDSATNENKPRIAELPAEDAPSNGDEPETPDAFSAGDPRDAGSNPATERPVETTPQTGPANEAEAGMAAGNGSIAGIVVTQADGVPVADVPVVLSRNVGEWVWTPASLAALEAAIPAWQEERVAALNSEDRQLQEQRAALAERLAGARASGNSLVVGDLEGDIAVIDAQREAIATDLQLWGYVQNAMNQEDPGSFPMGMAAAVLERLQTGTPVAGETVDETTPTETPAEDETADAATQRTRTDDAGRFAFADVPSGMWAVTTDAASHTPEGLVVVFVTAGAESTVTLRVVPACRITGVVQYADGTPVSAAHVRVQPGNDIVGERIRLQVHGAPSQRGTLPRSLADADVNAMPAWARRGFGGWRNPLEDIPAMEPPGWSTTTNETGHYAMTLPLADIDFRVLAWGDDTAEASSGLTTAIPGETIVIEPLVVGSLTGVRVQVLDDATGEPVEGALVRIQDGAQADRGAGMSQIVGDGYDGNWDPGLNWASPNDPIRETDAEGIAAFIPLRAIAYQMRVRARNYRTTISQEIIVTEGSVQSLIVRLDPGARVAGVVVDASGHPVAGADVRATLTRAGIGDASGFGPWDGEQLDEGLQVELIPSEDGGEPERVAALWYDRGVQTDGEGRFSLGGLGEYPVDLLVSHPEYEVSWTRGLDARASQSRRLRIILAPAASVSGTVRLADGSIPAEVRVFLRSTQASDQAMGMWGGDQNARYLDITPDAQFNFRRVTPGEYVVEALVPSFALATTQAFTVASGQQVTGLQIVCVEGGSIAGHVLTDDGQPVSGALVAIDDPGTRQLLSVRDVRRQVGGDAESLARMRTARTGPGGEFFMPNVVPGSYTLRAYQGDRQAETPAPVNVAEGQNVTGVEIRLEGFGRLVVTVLDEENRPLPRTRIMYTSGRMDFRQEQTGDDGRVTLTDLQPGQYRVMIAERGGSPGADGGTQQTLMFPARQVVVRSGETAEITLGGQGVFTTLKGMVYRNGRPAPDEDFVMVGDRIGARQLRTDGDGAFEVHGLAPGQYVIATGQMGMLEVLAEVRVWGQPTEHVRIDLVAAALRGFVTDTNNTPILGAQVTISRVDESGGLAGDLSTLSARNVESGAGGQFLIEDLTAGRYRIVARKDGYAHAEQTIVLSTTRHVIRLVLVPGGGEIHGTITGFEDPNMNPFFRGWVTLESASGQDLSLGFQSHWLRSSSFRFEGLAPGTYRVIVEQTGGQPNMQEVQVRADETTEVVFDIAQGGAILVDLLLDPGEASGVSLLDLEVTVLDRETGTVLDRTNAVLDLAMMFLNPVTGTDSPQEAYRVTLGGLPPGNLLLRIVLPGHGTVERDVEVTPGGSTPVTIDLR